MENKNFVSGPAACGAGPSVTRQEIFVNRVYSAVDRAAEDELDRLRGENGIIPPCKMGCSHCCRHHILMTIAEAYALAQYITRQFSRKQRSELRKRTQKWHTWNNYHLGRYQSGTLDRQSITGSIHFCPLLVDGACSAYPVRPVVCRTHFVSSHPRNCRPVNDPASTADGPVVLTSVAAAARPAARYIKDHIENAGLDFSRSQMLLPQWLAIEMGWNFETSP